MQQSTYEGSGRPNGALAERLTGMADAMQSEIDGKLAERLMNTPKRRRQAGTALNEGRHLQRTQTALRKLAQMHETGIVPVSLVHVTTRKKVHELTTTVIERTGGYYDPGVDTGLPYHQTPEAKAVWDMLGDTGKAERQVDSLTMRIAAARQSGIPGFFATPDPVGRRLIARATDLLRSSPASILEPSAGDGALADLAREAFPAAEITVYERNYVLKSILLDKGFDAAGDDFLEAHPPKTERYDLILMNPPFEHQQDLAHVRRAFEWLAPGGVLAAIISPAYASSIRSSAREFREWLDICPFAAVEPLPPGSFKPSGTGVDALILLMVR